MSYVLAAAQQLRDDAVGGAEQDNNNPVIYAEVSES
jgi:hypothetical protein